jgi:hypothetical protein
MLIQYQLIYQYQLWHKPNLHACMKKVSTGRGRIAALCEAQQRTPTAQMHGRDTRTLMRHAVSLSARSMPWVALWTQSYHPTYREYTAYIHRAVYSVSKCTGTIPVYNYAGIVQPLSQAAMNEGAISGCTSRSCLSVMQML